MTHVGLTPSPFKGSPLRFDGQKKERVRDEKQQGDRKNRRRKEEESGLNKSSASSYTIC